jgi:CheY-like chemotaxis protein
VEEMKPLLQAAAPKHVDVSFGLDFNVPEVQADASQLRQVIMSVFANATEAIPPEGRGWVRVATCATDSLVRLEIEDNGSGMDGETRARIFDPFFTTKFIGRGLGLSAALGMVRGHGGAIQVFSNVGEGSRFVVELPLSHPLAARASLAASMVTAGARVVLVVDDEQVVRELARVALERQGITVLTAENGQEALEVFSQCADRVSLVLLDLTMPVMGGEEALRRLREIRPDIPIVLSSGYSETDALRLFAGKGLAGFVQKPYSASRLVDALNTILAASCQ